jgi:hypothetical protein
MIYATLIPFKDNLPKSCEMDFMEKTFVTACAITSLEG